MKYYIRIYLLNVKERKEEIEEQKNHESYRNFKKWNGRHKSKYINNNTKSNGLNSPTKCKYCQTRQNTWSNYILFTGWTSTKHFKN